MIDQVIDAAQAAGAAIEAVRTRGFSVVSKGDAGPVTEADHAADALLKDRLLSLTDAAWLSEETVDSPGRLSARRLWIVDPLDGTKEFVAGVPEYAVAVALVENGQPVVAVVHNPAAGVTVWAEREGGVFVDGAAAHVVEGQTLLASRSELRRGEFDPFATDWTLEPVGSIAWKLALVAAGKGALTLSRGPKHEWDVCAGAMLVEAAGGWARNVLGGPLQYNQSHPKVAGVLAGAPDAFTRALDRLRAVGPSERMAELTNRMDDEGDLTS